MPCGKSMKIWDSDVTAAFALFILLSFTLHFTALSLVLIGPQCGAGNGNATWSLITRGFHIFIYVPYFWMNHRWFFQAMKPSGINWVYQPFLRQASEYPGSPLGWSSSIVSLPSTCLCCHGMATWRREVGDEFTQSFGYGQMDYQQFLDG